MKYGLGIVIGMILGTIYFTVFDNKGKKIAVYMGDKWHHFGDSSMQDYRQHKSEKRKDAFYSRHAKNLKGNDSRSKAFRVYARKTW